MVETQLRNRGIHDACVLGAMLQIPREEFVPHESRVMAYADSPVAIGYGQTISQPYITGLMAASLELTGAERVLEVGSGCGYAAAVLGAVMTAMLLGHFYLIAPGMSLAPLRRLLAALTAAVVARMALAGLSLYAWTAEHSLTNLSDVTVLWLPVRWGIGFIGPLVLAWMAWQTARIRSTQSATGILYVAVIFCFLGELTGQLLLSNTGALS